VGLYKTHVWCSEQQSYGLKAADMMAGNYFGHMGPPLELMDANALAKMAYKTDYEVCFTFF
jgi:hypothetical protein